MDLEAFLNNNRNMAATIILFAVAVGAAGWYLPRGFNLISIMLILSVFLVALGVAKHGLKRGIFISEMNLISLSRFQIIIWTVVILSAFFAISIERVHAYWDACGYFPSIVTDPALMQNLTYSCDCTAIKPGLFVKRIPNPLDIEIDWTVWALMGISTSSLVGASLLLGGKTNKQPAASNIENAAKKTGEEAKDVDKNRRGTIYGNPTSADSQFMDMFEGDEIGNTAYIDMAKVQMFFFTVISVLAYFIMVLQLTLGEAPANIDKLPLVPAGLLWILGISHAGYLGSKGIDHTQKAPENKEGPT